MQNRTPVGVSFDKADTTNLLETSLLSPKGNGRLEISEAKSKEDQVHYINCLVFVVLILILNLKHSWLLVK